jgi:hypothetical protein
MVHGFRVSGHHGGEYMVEQRGSHCSGQEAE